MARGDIWIARSSGLAVQSYDVKAGAATSIKAGEPVIKDGSNAGYVKSPGAGVDTDSVIIGFAISDSTDTASADGKVMVTIPNASTRFRGKAKTPGSLAQTQKNTLVVIDLTSSTYTIDQSTTTKGLCEIVDYNTTMGTIDFTIKGSALPNA